MKIFEATVLFVNKFILSVSDIDRHFSKEFVNQLSPRHPGKRLLRVFKYLALDILRLFIGVWKDRKLVQSDKVIFILSINNFNSTKFISRDDREFVFLRTLKDNINFKVDSSLELSYTYSFFYKLKYFLPFIKLIQKERHIQRLYDLIFKNIGLYEESLRYLKSIKPKIVIFSNDHSPQARALIKACNDLGIVSVYIQHASVSDKPPFFPPLSFSYAFLEGLHAKEVYQSQGLSDCKIILSGMPKFDEYIKQRKTIIENISTIGLAYSDNDSLTMVRELILNLRTDLPNKKIVVRPHPADKRTLNLKDVPTSDSKSDNSFDFLKRIDLLIASNSSIHLESCLMNIPSVYYKLSESDDHDAYGYIKNGVCMFTEEWTQLKNTIDSYTGNAHHFLKAKHYVNNVGSDTEGFSSNFICKHLKILEQ